MKVYDILGNEVATLVNEIKPAGVYNVEWNASDFPSGVYLYKLWVDGNIIDTKRMILLK
ncbi:MAG: T9SS type A sorting domain-containing protein [Ignavibacteria bacterium]